MKDDAILKIVEVRSRLEADDKVLLVASGTCTGWLGGWVAGWYSIVEGNADSVNTSRQQ
jgi:hypothetical protein